MKYKVIFGTPKGAKSWEEEVLREGPTDLSNEQLLEFAKKKYHNYRNIRVMIDDGKFPDFAGTVR